MPITVRTPAGERFYHEPIGARVYADTGRRAEQTPSQFTHPETGHAMGKSEIGDTFEEMFRQKGAHLLERHYGAPYSPVAHTKGDNDKLTSRTTPLDFKLDQLHGGELKTLNAKAKNQKTAIKKEELERKYRHVAQHGLSPVLAVQVVDMDNGIAHVYTHPDFASKRVTAMQYLGSYKFDHNDFRRAQQATGHWEKRHERAAKWGSAATSAPQAGPATGGQSGSRRRRPRNTP